MQSPSESLTNPIGEARGRGVIGCLTGELLIGERGQGVVEYALIILLIAIALIAGLGSLEAALNGAYAWISSSVAGAVP